MKRLLALLVFATTLAIAFAMGQTSPPKDVNGWGKIKWGMTLVS
jgi:hypothetical protein